MTDSDFMERAIALARKNVHEANGGPFGAVIVQGGSIVGEGVNRVTECLDPSAHAEVEAIRDACRRTGDFRLPNSTIYSTCEPCGMCWSAIHWARIDRIWYAATEEDAASIGFIDQQLNRDLRHPVDERQKWNRRLIMPDAIEMMREWRARPDRIPY